MNCGSCGHHIADGAHAAGVRFCTSCGAALEGPSRKARPKAVTRSRPGGRKGSGRNALIAVAGLGAMAALVLASRRGPAPTAVPAAASQAPSAFDASVRRIAVKFRCACGTCEVPELADCTCPTAVEEKRMIEDELSRGTSQPRIVRAVYRRYGHIKPRYAALVRDDEQGVTADGPAPVDATAAPVPAASAAARLATLADTTAVAQRFTCACGQCGQLPLADCDCRHPRGAAEMKAFIAYQIQKRRNVDEVVQAVAYEYGHLVEAPEGGS